jgi:hypothetical protein
VKALVLGGYGAVGAEVVSELRATLHLPGTDRWLALARAADGTTRWATGRRQSHATAVMAAAAARVAVRLPAAVQHLHTVLTLADVPAGRGIELCPAG